MYKVDSSKRYNVNVTTANNGRKIYKKVELIVAEPDFIVLRNSDGKEVILTGGIEICIEEV